MPDADQDALEPVLLRHAEEQTGARVRFGFGARLVLYGRRGSPSLSAPSAPPCGGRPIPAGGRAAWRGPCPAAPSALTALVRVVLAAP